MIPENNNTAQAEKKEIHREAEFYLFNPVSFFKRLLKNWYWFVLAGFLGYAFATFYNKYYAQRIYASTITVSISDNTA